MLNGMSQPHVHRMSLVDFRKDCVARTLYVLDSRYMIG